MTLRTDDGVLAVDRETHDGLIVVRFRSGKAFSDDDARELGGSLASILEELESGERVVVDLHGVSILSSSAIAKLLVFKRRVRDRGGDIRLCRPSSQVARTFRVTNLWDFLGVCPDFDSAVDSFE